MLTPDERSLIADFVAGIRGNLIDKTIVQAVYVKALVGIIDPDDVIQNTRLALLTRFREGQYKSGNLRAYVRRVAEIQCLLEIRRRNRNGKQHEYWAETTPERVDPSPDAEMLIEEKQRKAKAREILKRLGRDCCRLLVLRYIRGLSYREIGQRLSVTEGNARVMVHRCLQRSAEISKKLDESL